MAFEGISSRSELSVVFDFVRLSFLWTLIFLFFLYRITLGFWIWATHLMHRWWSFHNQMYAIHHRNWHLWHYNRFLLINWYMMRDYDIVASFKSNPRWKPHHNLFYDHVLDSYVLWLSFKNECCTVFEYRTTDYEICAKSCAHFAIHCIIKAPKREKKTDICYGWYISGCIAKWTNSWK